MKFLAYFTLICSLFNLSLTAQENNTLRGKVFFISSGKKPAVGVEVSGAIKNIGYANPVYSSTDGSYQLTFPKAAVGNLVDLNIGSTDGNGHAIELVNETEVRKFRISAIPTEEFEIIVAVKAERDAVAQRYYKIIKTSAERELDKMKKRLESLLAQKEERYQTIAVLSAKINKLQQQTDSLAIYREAFRLASINKDNASERVLKYLNLLDEGKSVQEAREVLSIKGAANDLEKGSSTFNAGIEELETRAKASESLFDYKDVVSCYNSIISYLEKMEIDRLEMSRYYAKAADANLKNGNYKVALNYQQKAVEILEKILDPEDSGLAIAYTGIGTIYHALKQCDAALIYHQKALAIQKNVLNSMHPDLAASYGHIALAYQALGRYGKALNYHKKSIRIREKTLNPEHSDLGVSYRNIALTYKKMGNFQKAMVFMEKSLLIFEKTLPENHPDYKKALSHMGIWYAGNKQFMKAKAVFAAYEKLFPKEGITYRNWVVYYALQNEKEKALSNLQKAVELGYNDLKWLKTDDSMDSLRQEKVFIEIVEQLEKEQRN